MQMFKNFIVLIISIISFAWADNEINDQYQRFELEEFTSMELELVADQATRIIFPFVLDSPNFRPTIKYTVKPSEVFSVSSETDVIGQNILILENIQNPEDVELLFYGGKYTPIIGQFFLSVGGYNVSIKLKTSAKPKDQIQNIVFDLPSKDRRHLIDLEVNRYKELIDKNFEVETALLDEKAKKHALSFLVNILGIKPKIKNVRIEQETDSENLLFFVDSIESYDDLYHAIRFELKNTSHDDVFIDDIIHLSIKGKDDENIINGHGSCQGRLNRAETKKCIFLTEDKTILKSKKIKTVFKMSKNNVQNTEQVIW